MIDYCGFYSNVAEVVGTNAAVVLEHLREIIRGGECLGVKTHNGKKWARMTLSSITYMLPFLSEKQARAALEKLTEVGLVLKGNLNDTPFDHTNWYAVTERAEQLMRGRAYEP